MRKSSYWLERPAVILFFLTLLILVIRLFLRGNLLELDEAEQVIVAQQLLPGYPDQPPFYSWLQYLFFKLFGFNLLSLVLLKCSLLFGCFYYFHQICRLHCPNNTLAWCTTLSWALIPAISLDLIKDNTHSVLVLFAACLTWYWFIAPSRLPKTVWYLIFGLIIGIGFLSKFNYLLFLSILLLSAISIDNYRIKLIHPGMLLTLVAALALASPYIFWLSEHFSIGLHARSKLIPDNKQSSFGLVEFGKAILFFASPVLLVTTIFFPFKHWQLRQTARNYLLLRYHLIGLPLLASIIVFAGISNFATRWLIPILFLCPLCIFSQVQLKPELTTKIRSFTVICLLVQIIFFGLLINRGHSERNKYNQFPVNETVQAIKADCFKVDYIVSDSYWLLGNLMLKLSIKNGWYLHPASPFSLPKGKLLLVWQSPQLPVWVNTLIPPPSKAINWVENPANNLIVTGRTYYVS
ncbi:TPA: glycosyltransferase family 39 protein [Legionella feeleii]